jgi:uncharacterized repeat protein (TIGR01451 family)
MTLRRVALLSSLTALALIALGGAHAAAAPIWNLALHHSQTNFTPGGTAQYWFEVDNIGNEASSGTITFTVTLPAGITRDQVLERGVDQTFGSWSCPGSPGDKTVICTTNATILRHVDGARKLQLNVKVAPSASGEPFASAKVEGGGAAKAATAVEPTPISSEEVGFGILAPSFAPDFFEADGLTPVREAGAHPALFITPFDFNSIATPEEGRPFLKAEAESIRDLVVDLPPGFFGAPTAVGECTAAQFASAACPSSSQVGRFDATLAPILNGNTSFSTSVAVYNFSHPRGAISDLGFAVSGNPVHIRINLDPTNRYAVRSEVLNINESLPPFHQKLTLWGLPADPSHASERCGLETAGSTVGECPTDATIKPFLTVPSSCEADNVMRIHHYDSWQNPGVYGREIDYTQPGKTTDCEKPRFEPDVQIVPTGKQANTPTGLDVHIKVSQNENPNALNTPPVKNTTVRLPEGMSFSPSFADGLKSCSLAQMKLGTNQPIECPDASRIGEVELSTPLLPHPAEGSMYLAAQGDNPFGSLFALYLVLHDTEERGALIKIPGRIDVDPASGQITTIFDELPQFPFDDMVLKFRSGPRAPLVSPPTCGTQTIGVEIASYAQPQHPVDASNTYQVTEGPNGTPCPPDSAHRSFGPKFSGGTLNPTAGSYSPFLFRLSREDQEQELSQATAVLPPGLLAKIAGIPFCPEQAIASISTAEGTGTSELNNPACPLASQIGSVSAGLGAGPGPNYFPGKIYLAGPYKGAPLSLAVVAPGLAGPFDLGNVVVRTALYVDPERAQAKAVSDPFPTILHGVILRVRDIRLRVDRPQTTINPTSCAQMAVDGEVSGLGGAIFDTASPFQVGDCGSLAFRPKLSFRLLGGTHRGSHPKLRAIVTMPPGGANIASASVALPHSEFLDQGHIGTVCTRVQFAANACPAASIYGTVSAKTPLLDEILSGPIYLRSSNNPLPDLVATFRGGRIDANLVGRVDSVNGGIRNTFDFVPDVPVSTAAFSFFGGRKGLLVNSRDICRGTPKTTAKFTAQNGDALTLRPALKSACGKARKAKGDKRPNRGRR